MNDFYQQYLTDKSYQLLVDLKKRYQFVLIGGWAVYFYSKALKSKDIDIVVDFSELEKIKKDFPLEKNERLKKYQIKIEEIDIDIYLPFYSHLGIPVKDIIKKTTTINGFTLPKKEILLITKLTAYQNRKSSIKGQKDSVDIFSLILLKDFDFKYFFNLIKKYKLKDSIKVLKQLLETTRELEELNLNQHSFAKIKKRLLEQVSSFQVTR